MAKKKQNKAVLDFDANMAIVRNVETNKLYMYKGNNEYENIITGKSGIVDEETARRIFKINMDATVLCSQYPMVIELIKKLKLKIDVQKEKSIS